jgi:hypothetical protein
MSCLRKIEEEAKESPHAPWKKRAGRMRRTKVGNSGKARLMSELKPPTPLEPGPKPGATWARAGWR